MKKTVFFVQGMDCSAEEQLIRLKLDGVNDILTLNFDLLERRLVVYHVGDALPIAGILYSLNLGAKLVETVDEEVAEATLLAKSSGETRLLWIVFSINFAFFAIEIIAGFFARSLGLIADSLDMLADAIIFGLSLYVVGKEVGSKKRIAKISGYLQLALAGYGAIEVVRRFLGSDQNPEFSLMIIISLLALIGNAVTLYLLHKEKNKEVHIKASTIFISNDVIINFGVIVAGILVYLSHSKYPDLIIGGIVFFIVGRGAFRILKLSE